MGSSNFSFPPFDLDMFLLPSYGLDNDRSFEQFFQEELGPIDAPGDLEGPISTTSSINDPSIFDQESILDPKSIDGSRFAGESAQETQDAKQKKLALYILKTPFEELYRRYADDVTFKNDIKALSGSDTIKNNRVLTYKVQKIIHPIITTLPPSYKTLLFHACKKGDLVSIKTTLERLDPKQNFRNADSQTPLHVLLSTREYSIEAIQVLVAFNPSWLEMCDKSGKYVHDYVKDSQRLIEIAQACFKDDPFLQLAFLLQAPDETHANEYLRAVDPSVWTGENSDALWNKMKCALTVCWQTEKKDLCEMLLTMFHNQNPTLAVLSLACEVDPTFAKPFIKDSLSASHPCQWPPCVDCASLTSWKYRPVTEHVEPVHSRIDDLKLALNKHPELVDCLDHDFMERSFIDSNYKVWIKTLFLDGDETLPVLQIDSLRKNHWLSSFLQSPSFPVEKLQIDSESIYFLYSQLTLYNEKAVRYIVDKTPDCFTDNETFYPFLSMISQRAVLHDSFKYVCHVLGIILQNKSLRTWDTSENGFCDILPKHLQILLWLFDHHPIFTIDPGLVCRYVREVTNRYECEDTQGFVEACITKFPEIIAFLDPERLTPKHQKVLIASIMKRDRCPEVILEKICTGIQSDVLEGFIEKSDNLDATFWRSFFENHILKLLLENHADWARVANALKDKVDLSGIVTDDTLQRYISSTKVGEAFETLFLLGGGIFSSSEQYVKHSNVGKKFPVLATVKSVEKFIQSRPAINGWKWEFKQIGRSLACSLSVQVDGEHFEPFRGYATMDAIKEFIKEYEQKYVEWLRAIVWLKKTPQNYLVSCTYDENRKEIAFRSRSFARCIKNDRILKFGKDFQDRESLKNVLGIERIYQDERTALSNHFPGIQVVIDDENDASLQLGECYILIQKHVGKCIAGDDTKIVVDSMKELAVEIYDLYIHQEHRISCCVGSETLRSLYQYVCSKVGKPLSGAVAPSGFHFSYPAQFKRPELVMLLGESHSAQLIKRSARIHHEFKELVMLHDMKMGLEVDVAACNDYTRRINNALKAECALPEEPAPVDLRKLLDHFKSQKEQYHFTRSLSLKNISVETAYKNLEHFVTCVIEKKGIMGWDPVKYEKEYMELQINLTHAVAQFLKTNDMDNLNSLIIDMSTCAPDMCSNRRADVGRSSYSIAFNRGASTFVREAQECQTVQDILALGYFQAFLETIDTLTQMTLDDQARMQSTHVNSCIRKRLKEELALDAIYDPRLSAYQNDFGRDVYAETGAEEFPQGSIRFFFRALFSIEYIRKLEDIQQELIQGKKWDLLGDLKQALMDAVEDTLKGPTPLCPKAQDAYILHVRLHEEKVMHAKAKLEAAKRALTQLQEDVFVKDFVEHKEHLKDLEYSVQETARSVLAKTKEIQELTELAHVQKKKPTITFLQGNNDAGFQSVIDEQNNQLTHLQNSQKTQKDEIEAIIQIGNDLFASNSKVQEYERAIHELSACESEYQMACQNRSEITQILEELLENKYLINPQDCPETLALKAWVYILQFSKILKPNGAPPALSTVATPSRH